MPAIVKLHKDGDNMAMSTNAQSEQEFLTALLPELAARLEHHADDLEFQLERWIPQIVDLCCKLRGYKADVREHRVLVAGEWLPADIVEAFTPRAIATAGA
jgi:hypothetical protein